MCASVNTALFYAMYIVYLPVMTTYVPYHAAEVTDRVGRIIWEFPHKRYPGKFPVGTTLKVANDHRFGGSLNCYISHSAKCRKKADFDPSVSYRHHMAADIF